MSVAEFVDTNIFVYAHDPDEGEKHAAAKALVERLWIDVTGQISTQVLQELYATVTRKKPATLSGCRIRSHRGAVGMAGLCTNSA